VRASNYVLIESLHVYKVRSRSVVYEVSLGRQKSYAILCVRCSECSRIQEVVVIFFVGLVVSMGIVSISSMLWLMVVFGLATIEVISVPCVVWVGCFDSLDLS
jgi:hypothetical protein